MKERASSRKTIDRLRKQAETILKEGKGAKTGIAEDDLAGIVHELEIHHIELELMNEELRRALRDLEISRDEYFNLYKSAPVGFVSINNEGVIERLNQAAADIIRRPVRYLVGQKFTNLVCPADLPSYYTSLKRISASAKNVPDSIHLRLSRADGNIFHARIELAARFDEKGRFGSMHFVIIDITKRKQIESALIESERKYSVVFNQSPYAISLASIRNDVIIDINQAWLDLFGFTREEALGKTIAELGIIRDRRERVQILDEFQQKGFVHNWETMAYRTKLNENSVLLVELQMVEIGGEGYVYTLLRDITDIKRAETALRESEERLHAFMTATSDVIYRMSPDWKEMKYLRGKDFITGTETQRRAWLERYIHRDDQSHVMAVINEAIRTKNVLELEHRVLRIDGTQGWAFSRAVPIKDANGEIIEWFCASTDITGRKNIEEALRKAHDEMEMRVKERTIELEKLNEDLRREIEERSKIEKELIVKSEKILEEQSQRKYLSKKLVEILEKERQDMAATLHDEVGQILTTIAADIDFVKEIVDVGVPVPTAEIENIQDRIRASIVHVGGLSRGLRPHILDNLGLLPALRSMLEDIKKSSRVECRLFTKNIPEHLKGEKALTIYRIIQEALTNCVRYAQAQNIDVTLTRGKRLILLTIEDDGVGFNYDEIVAGKKGRERLGIIIMNERAVQADGEFYIESRIGKGTRVVATIPVDKDTIKPHLKSRAAAADGKIGEAS